MDDQKHKEAQARLDALFHAEILAMKAKGATDADLREEVCQDMIRWQVLTRHGKEFDADIREMLAEQFLETALPASLREMAVIQRDKGDLDTAYSLEELADLRERGPGV